MKYYQIRASGESVCGGPVHLHRAGEGWRWQWGVAGRAVWRDKEKAERVATSLRCVSVGGTYLGPGIVEATDYPGEVIDERTRA